MKFHYSYIKYEETSLDVQLYLDDNFKTLLLEIFSFIHAQGGGEIIISGRLDTNKHNSFIITISEKNTPPLSFDVCKHLT